MENSGGNKKQMVTILSHQLDCSKGKIKSIRQDILNEDMKEVDLKESRKMITETSYRTFKELLCPVCLIFACPFHTPMDPQDDEDDGQELKGFAYNPFILEENF